MIGDEAAARECAAPNPLPCSMAVLFRTPGRVPQGERHVDGRSRCRNATLKAAVRAPRRPTSLLAGEDDVDLRAAILRRGRGANDSMPSQQAMRCPAPWRSTLCPSPQSARPSPRSRRSHPRPSGGAEPCRRRSRDLGAPSAVPGGDVHGLAARASALRSPSLAADGRNPREKRRGEAAHTAAGRETPVGDVC